MVNFSQLSKQINEEAIQAKQPPTQEAKKSGFNHALPDNYQLDEYTHEAYHALTVDKKPVIFLTGRAGTGKSTFIQYVKKNYTGNFVILTPTGMTALNIGGQTINSFFRFPPRAFEDEDIGWHHHAAIDHLDLIIIDEISMVQSDMLDHIDFALRKWRKSSIPFAGIQLLLVGDCFQLSPWIKFGAEKQRFEEMYRSQWFFDANVFERVDVVPINLEKIYRQRDPCFTNILNRIRIKHNHEQCIEQLNQLCFFNKQGSNIEDQLILTTTNDRADNVNAAKLSSINEPSFFSQAITEGKVTEDIKKTIPDQLELKVGAQVMVTKNITGAANGTLGIVKQLFPNKVIVEKLDDGQEIECSEELWEQFNYEWNGATKKISSYKTGAYKQIPLRLGWAITIHKSQGLTFDSVKIDLTGGAFAPGQTYVALSRCRTLEKISFDRPISLKDIIVDQKIYEFYKRIFTLNSSKLTHESHSDTSLTSSNLNSIYLSRIDFDEKLKEWYSTSNDPFMGSYKNNSAPLFIKQEDSVYKLNQDTKRHGVKLYLDLLAKYQGKLPWVIVANENGRMNKVAFGYDKVIIPGFYLYFVDK
ncbi:MAG: DEAD/DEAH box helicase [Methylovulum sp.]|nr:DEAD/DEAH box helicase [Methylovulum sp.]